MSGSRWSARYEIRVDGVLDDQWADWFGGLQLSNGGTQTIIVGLLPDQSALHGVLAKIRDLGLCLTLVCPLDADDAGDRPQIWHLIEIGSCHHRHTGSIIRSSPGRWMLSTGPRGAWPHPVTGGHSFAGTAVCSLRSTIGSAGAGQVSTLPSRGPKRRLVPMARLDELLGRAATVGVSVGHRAAQLLDG